MSVAQLNGAKAVVRENPSLYPEIVKGILNIADRPETDLRRWCAAFLVDAFASPDLSEEVKQTLATEALAALATLVGDGDYIVLRHTITCISIVYPLLFSYVGVRPMEGALWDRLLAIKQRALAHWSPSQHHLGVAAACIKLAAVVVQTQSKPGRRGDVSLANVPAGHPLLDPAVLGAEAAGLLDRLLAYFGERDLDVVYFQATLNAVLALVDSRPALAAKIVSAVLTFDVSRKRLSCSSDAVDLALRFVDKTLQLELGSLVHANMVPQHTAGLQRYLARLSAGRANATLRKRAAEVNDSPQTKRVRLATADMPLVTTTRLPAGDVPLRELYSLADADNALAQFSSRDLQLAVAVEIAMSSLSQANPVLLENCLGIVAKRYESIPEAGRAVKRPTDTPPPDTVSATPPAPEAYDLAHPPKFSAAEATERATALVERLRAAAEGAPAEERATGVEALRTAALTKWTQNAWVILASRAATRGPSSPVASAVRDFLYNYVITDFRQRLEVTVYWLSEEWYAERVLGAPPATDAESIYYQQVARVIDQLLPRVEVSDSRVLIRLFSELPDLSRDIVFKLSSVCQDPERGALGFRTLKFLIAFKPPTRAACLDLAEELYRAGFAPAEAILKRYRPAALAEPAAA